jgi:hypothetical protein
MDRQIKFKNFKQQDADHGFKVYENAERDYKTNKNFTRIVDTINVVAGLDKNGKFQSGMEPETRTKIMKLVQKMNNISPLLFYDENSTTGHLMNTIMMVYLMKETKPYGLIIDSQTTQKKVRDWAQKRYAKYDI